jgi:hypothetical protein
MAGRHPNRMRPRDESAHPVVQDAIDRGYLVSGEKYHVPGLMTHDIANTARLSVGRALEHFGLSRAAWVTDADGNPCFRDCKDPSAPHGVGFQLYTKDGARAHVVRESGGDPAKLKFNPHMPRKTGRFSDDGKWIPCA